MAINPAAANYPMFQSTPAASAGGTSPARYLAAVQSLQVQLRNGLISEGDFQRSMGALQAQVMAESSGGMPQTAPMSESQMLAQMEAAQKQQAAMALEAIKVGLPPGSSLEQIQQARAEQARARAMGGGTGQTGPMTESQFEQQMNAARARQAAMAAEAMKLGLPPNATMEQIQRARAEQARAAAMGGGAETPREPTRSDFGRMLNQLRHTNPRYARRLARQLQEIRRDNPGSTFAQNFATLV